jgi:hypothetical protein
MTLPPPQNLHPPVFLWEPYNRLHYSPFIFVTQRALRSPSSPYTQMTDTALLSQSWRPDTISCRLSNAVTTLRKYFITWELLLNAHKTETILFSKRRPPLLDPIQTQENFVPWASTVRYLGLELDSKRHFNQHLHTVANKSTGVFCNIFLLLARDLVLTQCNKLALYRLLI